MSPHRYARCSYSVQYSVQVGCIIDLTQNCHRNSQGYPIQHTYPCMRYRDLMDESWSYLSAVSSSLSIPSDTGFILPWRSLILLYSVLKAPQQTTPNSAMRFLFRARPMPIDLSTDRYFQSSSLDGFTSNYSTGERSKHDPYVTGAHLLIVLWHIVARARKWNTLGVTITYTKY